MGKRLVVKDEDFIRVVILDRAEFPTAQDAAAALGYTSVECFKQRLKQEQERYPALFGDVPDYPRKSHGPRKKPESDMLALLQKMQAERSADSEEAEDSEDSE